MIDIDTSMGDGTQLGHASSLQSGQTVPDGQRWHGSPGQQTVVDNFLTVDPAPCGTLRKVAYAVYQLLTMLLILPLGITGAILLLRQGPEAERADGRGHRCFHRAGRSTATPWSCPLCCSSARSSSASSS